jgi:hypothetical protein
VETSEKQALMHALRHTRFACTGLSLAFTWGLAAAFTVQIADAAEPYTRATVARLQNDVKFGATVQRATRPARVADVIQADSYLLTETDSRAELRYDDGSIVRVGQNTVFTFEADTRTLSLERGSLVFSIPKGSGGGKIRTASITAAITGTIGKLSDNIIAILDGEVRLIPSGRRVPAGYFARVNADGTITIAQFDPSRAMGGKLMDFGGPLAGFDESSLLAPAGLPGAESPARGIMDQLEGLDRVQNLPGPQEKFLPPPPRRQEPKIERPRRAAPTPAPPRPRDPDQPPVDGQTGGL